LLILDNETYTIDILNLRRIPPNPYRSKVSIVLDWWERRGEIGLKRCWWIPVVLPLVGSRRQLVKLES
jgi:hypothetical protein